MLYRAFGADFTLELPKVDSAITVVIEFLDYLRGFLLRHVEPTALNDSSNFISTDRSISVQIETVERLVGIEVRGEG